MDVNSVSADMFKANELETVYSVEVTNNSQCPGYICIYQENPNKTLYSDLLSLAWLCAPCKQSVTVFFEWKTRYELVWSSFNIINKYAKFMASQKFPVDLQSKVGRAATLTKGEFGYKFTSEGDMPEPGMVTIHMDGTVVNGETSVGIAMHGMPVFATPAKSNFHFTFKPHPIYKIAFGDFRAGEVIDTNMSTDIAEIKFGPGIYHKKIILNESSRWIIN